MSEYKPPFEKNENRFRISTLIDNDRYFLYTINARQKKIDTQTSQSQSLIDQPYPNEPSSATTTAQTGTTNPTATISENAFSRALLSTDDLNSIVDIWSPKTTEIHNYSLKEYNLTDAAGLSFVSQSGDLGLSIEIYHFSNDSEMASKVSNALEEIYLRDMGYAETYMACPIAVSEPSWIFEKSNSRYVLGKVIRYNFISIAVSSNGFIDNQDAVQMLCSVVEKQAKAIKAAGY